MSACKEDKLSLALRYAGKNRTELEKVLRRYEKDSLKYRAACFLIENMPYHNYYEGEALNKYMKYFYIYKDGHHKPQQIVDSLIKTDGACSIKSLTLKRDIENINAAFIENNIEWAFKVWHEQPWGKNVSFEDFCEFILPYRVGDEPPSIWREKLYNKYNPLLDSIKKTSESEDPLIIAKILIDIWQKKPYNWTNLFPSGPHLGPIVTEWKSGTCREFTDGVEYILRAVGVPCGTDKMIIRGETNASHFWGFVLDKNKKSYITDPILWSYPQNIDIPRAKVHRTTYSLNEQIMKDLENSSIVHPIFIYPLFRDVTPIYADNLIKEVQIPINELYNSIHQGTVVYLCLSDHKAWIPVDYTISKNKKVTFNNVESGVVCVLATWDGKDLKIQSDPFSIDKKTGLLNFFHPTNELENIELYCKFSLTLGDLVYRMKGGVIEGSNYSNFRIVDTLYFIKEAPKRLFTTVYPNPSKSYKYVRYRGGKDSYSNIAELSVYEKATDSLPLKGKILGTPGCWDGDGLHEYTNVFDGDPYTSFDYKKSEGGWAGLDLGHNHFIRKIIYTPRNRDNFIHKGDSYELFYWKEGKWQSLGHQTAKSDFLRYSVPNDALFYLKNHTHGNDERIFEYKDRKQIFW